MNDELRNQVLKGCDYLEALPPSKMMITGVVNPKQWMFLMRYVKLVRACLSNQPIPMSADQNLGQIPQTVETMSEGEVKKIFG